MITANKFRYNIFPICRVAEVTDVGFEVIYKGQVFDVTFTKTNKKAIRTDPNRIYKKKSGLDKIDIKLDTCTLCGTLMVSGLCLDKTCTNSRLH